jgi:fibronectin-binding autotransporter adhesin
LLLSSEAFAQTNTEDDVVNGQSDLTVSATYTGGSPTTSSDVTFLSGTTYSPTAFTLNTTAFNLVIGTLDDLDATQAFAIQNTTSASVSTITLDGGVNSVAPSNGGAAGDLLFVASGGTLAIGGGSGTLGLALGAATNLGNVGNFDIAGTATISSVISGTGNGFTMTGNGTLTLSGANTYSGGAIIGDGTSTSTLKLGGIVDLHGDDVGRFDE